MAALALSMAVPAEGIKIFAWWRLREAGGQKSGLYGHQAFGKSFLLNMRMQWKTFSKQSQKWLPM